MTDTTSPDPIRHLVTAVTSLGFAVRDLHDLQTPGPKVNTLRQDCAEHADEAIDILSFIRRLLDDAHHGE